MNIDALIEDLQQGKHLLESQLIDIFTKLIEIMSDEDNLLLLEAPINVIGDVHGQLFDVFNMMDTIKENGLENNKFLFLGDFVDRGHFSIETIAYLALLKIRKPDEIFLLRGNHESPAINQMYGFFNDCVQLYGSTAIWSLANKAFQYFPLAAIISNKYFCVHGGLSPELRFADQLYSINRVCDISETGIMADLTWSDPMEEAKKWTKSKRGSGYIFGRNETEEFLRNNKLEMVVRSHQLANDGYEELFMKDGRPQLLTVWSAPNYCYTSGNRATFMAIDDKLEYQLIEFSSREETPFEENANMDVCPYFA
jgi:diadenosine tetraphosphatase ApaH/serine/threonine PP2A family protein phosphatase